MAKKMIKTKNKTSEASPNIVVKSDGQYQGDKDVALAAKKVASRKINVPRPQSLTDVPDTSVSILSAAAGDVKLAQMPANPLVDNAPKQTNQEPAKKKKAGKIIVRKGGKAKRSNIVDLQAQVDELTKQMDSASAEDTKALQKKLDELKQ